MLLVGLSVRPLLEAKGGGAFVGAEAEQARDRNDVAPARPALGDPFQLTQLLERVDQLVRLGADADADPALAELLHRREAVAEVGLRRRTDADARARLGEQV